MPVTEELLKAASEADVSLVIIGRTAGEDQDNSDTEGSYRLQKEEENLIKSITEVSRRTVVLINSGNIIDMSWVNRYHPQGVLYVWQGGQEGGNGVKIRRMSVSLYPYWNVWRIDMAVIRSFLELKY